tara:strand:+ start:3422 stop:3628 length:207 start_codon:yes stop_codon:yes gene_type:complete
MITKAQLRTIYTLEQIGNIFGITKGAVHQWPEDKPIDKKYEYVLRHNDDEDIKAVWKRFNPDTAKEVA